MISIPSVKLKEILLKAGLIESSIFDQIDQEAQRKKQNPIDILISRGIINREYIFSLLAQSLGFELVNLGAVGIDDKVLHLLPEDIARRLRAVPFAQDQKGTFFVAMEDPTNLESLDFLSLRLKGKIRPFLATDEDLNRGFAIYEKRLTTDFKKIIEESIQASLQLKARGDLSEAAAELPIVAIVDNLLAYAVSSRASDIHFEMLEDGVLVRYRIDGILHEIIRMSKEVQPPVVARIKILSSLRVDEHTHPQDGRFRSKIGDQLVDIRVSIIPTFYGEKVEMRLLTAAQKPLSFSQLGLLEGTVKLVEESIKKTYGMVLSCGPTGSGKTTTLYSMMNILNRPEVNVVTIEDPIEYDMRYVNQMQVNVAAGITFATGLRSILRQDPDVIMIGEIRDKETANIAVQSALTGHLVLSSLHTNDASTAIPRLIDMGIPPFLVAAVLNSILAQRLARRIHLGCIESYKPDATILATLRKQLEELGIEPERIQLPKILYRGKGCTVDGNTGYFGRIGIFEAIDVNEEIRRLITDPNFSLDSLKKVARKRGMITMLEDGLKKVERGLTTVEEIFRVIRE